MRLKSYLQSHKTYIIAEMSANHAGSLETALRLVEAAKEVGADCLKTQIYSADTLTIHCDRTPFKIHEGLWAGQTLYSLYEQASMPWDWHQAIQKKCREVGIDFLATAYDTRSVDYIISLDIPAIKIASFEIVDIPLIRYAAKSGKTMLLSCGMSSSEEIRNAVNTCFREGNHDVILLKCSSAYAMLREEFQNVETDTRNYILVLTGGSDPYNIATHLVRELLPLIGEKASIVVVSSSLNPNIEELRMVCNDEKVCLLENVRNMAMVMKHAILAISSGGSTLYELCACGIPTITYAIAPNQMDNVLEFDRLELMKFSGYYPDCPRKVLSSIASSCIVLKNDALRQSVLAIKLRDMCDGAGSLRVAEAIVSM